MLRLAAAAQKGSEHPLARAFLERAEGLALPPLEAFQAYPGKGLVARVEGRRIAIGNRRLMTENSIPMEALETQAARLEEAGRTVMWVAALETPARLIGVVVAADPVKPTAAAAVRRLHEIGVETVLLDGRQRADRRRNCG